MRPATLLTGCGGTRVERRGLWRLPLNRS